MTLKESYHFTCNATKRQHISLYTPDKLQSCLCQGGVVPRLAEPCLVNFNASSKLWSGVSGWLMKSGYTA